MKSMLYPFGKNDAVEIDDAMLEAVARAYDGEDAAINGEPDQWATFDKERGDPRMDIWRDERRACALAALEALVDHLESLDREDEP